MPLMLPLLARHVVGTVLYVAILESYYLDVLMPLKRWFVQCYLRALPALFQGMVNGTRGVIIGFEKPGKLRDNLGGGSASKMPKVRFSLPGGETIEKLIFPYKWP